MARLAAGIVVGLLLAGCQSAAASRSNHPIAASPRPIALSCRLPMVSYTSYVDALEATPGAGGWLNLADGAFSPDPAALGSYDAAVRRWVPAERDWIAPDGLHYAYSRGNANQRPSTHPAPPSEDVYVVDAATGAMRDFHFSEWYSVATYEPEGVYLYRFSFNGPRWGLWLLDPSTGQVTALNQDPNLYWEEVGHGAAWALQSNKDDYGFHNSLARLDLRSKAITTTALDPNGSFQLIGLDDAGQPVLTDELHPGFDVLVGQQVVLHDPAAAPTLEPLRGIADRYGLWFGSADGTIWLYARGTLRQVGHAALPTATPAGDCA